MAYKLTRKRKRIVKRRPFNMTRKKRTSPKGGFLKVVRWSSRVTQNTHVYHGGNDTVPTGDATITFSMADVNGFAELVSLFDNFRITKVLYRWVILRSPEYATGAANKGIYPRITWTHDFNDAAIISRNLIYQRANMKEHFFTDNSMKTRWYSLNPSVLLQAYEGPASTAYTPKWRQWLDTSDNATPHYGIKYSYNNLYAGVDLVMEAKLVMECKGIS